MLNNNVCPKGMTCRLPSMYLWNEIAITGMMLPCEEALTKESCSNHSELHAKLDAQTAVSLRALTLNSAALIKNCELADGSFAQCNCGLNGNAYCRPDPSSSVFDATGKGVRRSGELSNYDTFTYAAMMSSFYSAQVEPVTCAKDIFMELLLIDDLSDGKRDMFTNAIGEESSATCLMALSVLGVLSLI
jgi:hypothetical protein